MAKQLTTASIATGQTIEASHVTQSSVAFTGGEAYDITISGSLTVTGSTNINGTLSIPGFPDVSASLASSGGSGGFPFTGSAEITGSLEVTGSTNILASEGSNLTLEINESASFEFLTGAPNSGSFIVQTSPDTGLGSLESFFGQGTAVAAAQNIPNQIFGIKYASGSGASEGELTMTVGKRDLSNLGGANQNNFYVSYEPSGIFTNAQGELEFFVGEHQNVGHGVLSVYRGGASGLTQTSSFAGYFSSSAFPGQQQYTRPFAISATSTVSDSNSAFVINKNVTDLTTSNFSVDYGGNVTASGNISASGEMVANSLRVENRASGVTADVIISGSTFDGDSRDAQIIYPNHGLHFNSDVSNNHVLALAGNSVGVRIQPDGTAALTVSGSVNVIDSNITASGNISASGQFIGDGSGLINLQRPITTHTANFSASAVYAGNFNIVGGSLTCSISTSAAAVGAEWEFFQTSSAGNFLFETGSGITLYSKDGNIKLAGQSSAATLKKISADSFALIGDLTS